MPKIVATGLDCTCAARTVMSMPSAAKSSTVRLYVSLVGFLSDALGLLGSVVRLVRVLVTALIAMVQHVHARVAARTQKACVFPAMPARSGPMTQFAAPVDFAPSRAPSAYTAAAAPLPAPPAPYRAAATPSMAPVARLEVKRPTEPGVGPAPRLRVAPTICEPAPFVLPSTECLEKGPGDVAEVDQERLQQNAAKIVETLGQYGVQGKVEDILPGPTVTLYEVTPAPGTKVSKVAGLVDDLALALGSKVRVLAPIPGKNRIGFELPSDKQAVVSLRDLVEDSRFQAFPGALPVVLGRDTTGQPVYADLATMPHVIVAGATGSGKSVGLNVMLTSLLFRKGPEELRMLMIDPKVVELAPFNGLPHMLCPVVTDMSKAVVALQWAVGEMERRYQMLAKAGARNIASYNEKVPAGGEKLPSIVIVVDEYADLMMQQGKEVEETLARLAQKARASGIHVILATQRPSVDVISGVIKANFPSRIAFRVSQRVDSRTILDEQGAELLLGKGDMLVKINGADAKRVQCPWISEEDVARVTGFLRQSAPRYDDSILNPKGSGEPVPVRGMRRQAPDLHVVN